ncbi:uncharacterized protein NECHADRAFT_87979 [Fusarium vanettenii 77-13-4]|uniref:Lysine-specific metallo-endopeptidase domain-containing protein n=1 Tax=Fusarium vanettenii (strain ATCC MYA-4622 / CBS 123669 / FGSC 9596 / NRRL 45880 / 77-13-4) TaxID=660122 RepID=C7ZJY6_FUSV7|nr:uncharacterized protein NECHADRAFT_87979 [Fusarium vanettenii 77-13-4]EEU35713.1 predicted protein [Fusarium vanettenii 77-13-4]
MLPSYSPHLVLFVLILGLLSHSALAVIESAFKVKQGLIAVGGCDSHKAVLRRWWSDMTRLVDAALENAADDNEHGAEYMQTFFGLDPPPQDAGHRQTAREQEWGDTAYNKDTGERFAPDPETGTTTKVSDVVQSPIPDPEDQDAPKEIFPFWSSDLKEYPIDVPGDYCTERYENNGNNFGSTHGSFKVAAVTICVQNIKVNKKEHLGNLGTIKKTGQSIIKFVSQSMTLFHELFHVVLTNDETPETDRSYDLDWITGTNEEENYATTEEALSNPESYTLYALARLLGKRNLTFTFASAEARKREDVNNT